MAKEKKRSVDGKLAWLRAIRNEPITAALIADLQYAVGAEGSLLAAEAAKIIKDRRIASLIGDLVAAFDRFMIDADKSDKQCRAKIEIVDALNQLEYAEAEVFLRGLRHRQDGRYGEPGQDAAGTLRAYCALGLARIGHRDVVLLLTEALLDTDDTARAGAARALGHTGSLTAIPLLRYKVRTGDRVAEIIGECFTSLLTLSFADSLPFVAEYLRSPSSAVQDAAVLALAETRRPEACSILSSMWSEASAELRDTLLIALAMLRLSDANDFLIKLIAAKDASAKKALAALAIHRQNPSMVARIAAAVEANGGEAIREWFAKKFSASALT